MRDDRADQNAQIALQEFGVDLDRRAERRLSDGRAVVPREVVADPAAGEHVGADLLLEILPDHGPVIGDAGQDQHVCCRDPGGFELVEDRRDQPAAGGRTRQVVDDDDRPLATTGELAQRRRPEGIGERRGNAGCTDVRAVGGWTSNTPTTPEIQRQLTIVEPRTPPDRGRFTAPAR